MRLAAAALLGALVWSFVNAFVGGLAGQAAAELILWAPRLAEALVRAGARLFIPRSHRQRYTDEWLAHLDDFRAEHDTALATIVCAVGIVLKGATGTVPPRTPGSDQPAPGHEAHKRRSSPRQTFTELAVSSWVVVVGLGFVNVVNVVSGNVVSVVASSGSLFIGSIYMLMRWHRFRRAGRDGR